jgi:hypothetical protein
MMKVSSGVWVIAVLITAGVHGIALADKLSDFKDADRYNEGCDTIPNTSNYSSDQRVLDAAVLGKGVV